MAIARKKLGSSVEFNRSKTRLKVSFFILLLGSSVKLHRSKTEQKSRSTANELEGSVKF